MRGHVWIRSEGANSGGKEHRKAAPRGSPHWLPPPSESSPPFRIVSSTILKAVLFHISPGGQQHSESPPL